jgi:hypothetical protein
MLASVFRHVTEYRGGFSSTPSTIESDAQGVAPARHQRKPRGVSDSKSDTDTREAESVERALEHASNGRSSRSFHVRSSSSPKTITCLQINSLPHLLVDEPVELCTTRLRCAQIHGFSLLAAEIGDRADADLLASDRATPGGRSTSTTGHFTRSEPRQKSLVASRQIRPS